MNYIDPTAAYREPDHFQRPLYRFVRRVSGGAIQTEQHIAIALLIATALLVVIGILIFSQSGSKHSPDEYGIQQHTTL